MKSIKYIICCCVMLSVLAAGCAATERPFEPAKAFEFEAGYPAEETAKRMPEEADYQAVAQDESVDLAKQLQNPIATLISVPIQSNYDRGFGANDDGSVWQTNIQPVYPFTLNKDWHLISRTIVPIIHQKDIPTKGEGESGIGDITQAFFFSPAEPTKNGWIWGAGPVMLLPTASDGSLGTEKWGLGPTAVVLKQEGPWTVGALANHIWSVAGEDNRSDVDASYFEPWVSYTTKSDTTISLSVETVYDWEASEASIPINFIVDQLFQVGGQYILLGGSIHYWADSPSGGPEGFGYRLQMTFLFPKF